MVPAAIDPALDAIEQAWSQTIGRALHGPSCSCCGAQAILLDAEALGGGIEHALLVRFGSPGDKPALRLLHSNPLGEGQDFVGWLRRLAAIDVGAAQPVVAAAFAMLGSVGQGPAIRR